MGIRIDFGGYEADYIEASNSIIVGGDFFGKVKEFDADTGEEIWHYGERGMEEVLSVNLVILIIFETSLLIFIYMSSTSRNWLKLMWTWAKMFLLCTIIAIELFLLVDYRAINVFFFVHTIC